jgi:hypothetical protein
LNESKNINLSERSQTQATNYKLLYDMFTIGKSIETGSRFTVARQGSVGETGSDYLIGTELFLFFQG